MLNMETWEMRDISADNNVSSSCTSTPCSWKTATWNHFCDIEHVRLSCWRAWLRAKQLYRKRMQLMFSSILAHPPPEAQRMIAIFSLVPDL